MALEGRGCCRQARTTAMRRGRVWQDGPGWSAAPSCVLTVLKQDRHSDTPKYGRKYYLRTICVWSSLKGGGMTYSKVYGAGETSAW